MTSPRENNGRKVCFVVVALICALCFLDRCFRHIPAPIIVTTDELDLPLTIILKDSDNDTISIINIGSSATQLPSSPSTSTTEMPAKILRKHHVDPIIAANELYQCYTKMDLVVENATKVPDLLGSDRQPTPDKTIFFLVTNCIPDGLVKITARQACAIESAAVTNPDFDVFVVFSSPAYFPSETNGVLRSILTYNNVFLRYSNPWRFTKGTPAEHFFKKGDIFKSKHFAAHMSDLLRIVTLWRWGGTYMDLDIVMKKSLANVPQNFAGAESYNTIANGVMNYESNGFGHYIADLIVKNLVENYDGSAWAYNGPLCVTRVLATKICHTRKTAEMTNDKCRGFRAMPKDTFYAIHFHQHPYFFEEAYLEKGMEMTKNSILIHVWNNLSRDKIIKVGSKTVYGVHAKQFCPKTYGSCGEYF